MQSAILSTGRAMMVHLIIRRWVTANRKIQESYVEFPNYAECSEKEGNAWNGKYNQMNKIDINLSILRQYYHHCIRYPYIFRNGGGWRIEKHHHKACSIWKSRMRWKQRFEYKTHIYSLNGNMDWENSKGNRSEMVLNCRIWYYSTKNGTQWMHDEIWEIHSNVCRVTQDLLDGKEVIFRCLSIWLSTQTNSVVQQYLHTSYLFELHTHYIYIRVEIVRICFVKRNGKHTFNFQFVSIHFCPTHRKELLLICIWSINRQLD